MALRVPATVRARAVRAGREAQANYLAVGGGSVGARAEYLRCYNHIRANYLYAASPTFRAKNLKACRQWRARQVLAQAS